jgi:hypothetical protein
MAPTSASLPWEGDTDNSNDRKTVVKNDLLARGIVMKQKTEKEQIIMQL